MGIFLPQTEDLSSQNKLKFSFVKSLTILIPDTENLAEIENDMDESDFHTLVSPKFKTQEEIKDDKILMVNEVVNVTMPIIDSTYVNHHLDKSLLMVNIILNSVINFTFCIETGPLSFSCIFLARDNHKI